MRSYSDMAHELAFALSDELLVELVTLLDGDRDDDLLAALNVIVAERHPELFAGEPATPQEVQGT